MQILRGGHRTVIAQFGVQPVVPPVVDRDAQSVVEVIVGTTVMAKAIALPKRVGMRM